MKKNKEYLERAKKKVPGITQLLSKRPDQFAPGTWPTYYSKAKGTEIWDLEGQQFLDMSISGIGANILGYCDPDVDAAVIKAVTNCNSSSLNCPEEIELAEVLCELHPWAERARFSKSGGEAMSIAVRIARAASQRDKIVFCGYHGWHDWYLAANLESDNALTGHLLPGLSPAGVPKVLRGTAIPFEYNKIEQLKNILKQNPNEIAAIVMEPIRSQAPLEGFLKEVQQLAKRYNAALIFDEISSGFRLTTGGAHLTLGVDPDMAVFSKALSNGYPMAAIIGTREIMDSVENSFISSTYWTDRIGPSAALATINKHKNSFVSSHLDKTGASVQDIWKTAAIKYGLDIEVSGINPMSYFKFLKDTNLKMMTFYIQEMLKFKILSSNRFYANFAHQDEHIERYRDATNKVFQNISELLIDGKFNGKLSGQVMRPGFHRFN